MLGKIGKKHSADLLFELLSKSTDNYLYILDLVSGEFIISDNAFEELDLEDSINTDVMSGWGKVMYPDDLKPWLEDIEKIFAGLKDVHNMEYRMFDKQGNVMWVSCRGKVHKGEDGTPLLLAGTIANIGKQSKFDNITGLKNRNEFQKDLEQILCELPTSHGAAVIMDIDNFKHINERHGHAFGNRVLHAVARVIGEQLPQDCQLYRLDGDEYAFLLPHGEKEEVQRLFEEIQLLLTRNFMMENQHLFVSISAGACLYPEDGDNYLELLRHAESAIDIAKINGKNQLMFFSKEVHDQKLKIIDMQESLHNAVTSGFKEFELYYQPQVDTKSGRVIGAEALLRWHSPRHGEVSPAEFIPLLEESNLIIQVGKWVLKEAVHQCSIWQKIQPDFAMSINVSYIQLKEHALFTYLSEEMDCYNLPADSCILELTENCWVPDLKFLNHEFKNIQDMGYGIAIDDFGTGYSSLNHLKELPANLIKIDRSFIMGIQHNSYEYTFLEYIIKLAHIIGLSVCVEGVETREEFEVVKGCEPDSIQGFYFGRPVGVAQFEKQFLNASLAERRLDHE